MIHAMAGTRTIRHMAQLGVQTPALQHTATLAATVCLHVQEETVCLHTLLPLARVLQVLSHSQLQATLDTLSACKRLRRLRLTGAVEEQG